MPSPPQSPTYLANLTVRKPTHENDRPHKRAKREESPRRASRSHLTQTLIPKADTAADIDDDEDEVKVIADDKINKEEDGNEDEDKQDEDEEQCSICLQPLVDRTVIPTCAHEFCFECILVWTEQSRKCPLCAQPIREHLIHHIRARYDYQKHYLAPLRSRSPNQLLPLASSGNNNGRSNTNTGRDRTWGRRARIEAEERQVADALEREIAKRKWVYEHRLFAKHVASNPYTRYRPAPAPAAFAANPVLVSRATAFLRRELRVWDDQVDGEWLTTYVVSLMKAVDVRSEAAVRLLAEFLDVDGREVAEHFAHEVYAYLRSPYRDLGVYDTVVQYDTPENVPPPAVLDQSRRWRPAPSPSRSRSRSLSPSRSRSRERGGSRIERDGGDKIGKYKGKRPAHDRYVEVIDVDMESNIDVREGPSRDTREHREHRKRKKGESARTRKEVIDVDSDSDPRDDGHIRRRRSRSRSRRGERREDDKGTQRERDERGGKGKRAVEVEVIDVDVDMHGGDGSCGGTRKERERKHQAHRRENRQSRSRSRAHEERYDNGKGKQRARSRSRTRGKDTRSQRDGKEKRPERVRDAEVIDVDMDDDPPFHAKGHPERHGPGKKEKGLVKGSGRDSEGIDVHSLDERQRSPAARNGASNGTEHLGDEREIVDLDPPPAPAAPAAPDVQTAAKRIPVRPPRNLGLLGAVHAHLGAPAPKPKLQPPGEVPTESVSNMNKTENAACAALRTPPGREQPQKPVLLARISDIASIASTPAPSSNATSPPDTPVLASPDPEQQPRQSHSAREIMARTRARLAKLKNQPVAGVSVPASPTPLDTPPPGADVDTRARLMDRLEEEKRQVEADATAVPLAEADAGVQTEAVLRKKAQVRVRLAAAKREREGGRVLLADDDAVGVVGENGREEELKLKIRARR